MVEFVAVKTTDLLNYLKNRIRILLFLFMAVFMIGTILSGIYTSGQVKKNIEKTQDVNVKNLPDNLWDLIYTKVEPKDEFGEKAINGSGTLQRSGIIWDAFRGGIQISIIVEAIVFGLLIQHFIIKSGTKNKSLKQDGLLTIHEIYFYAFVSCLTCAKAMGLHQGDKIYYILAIIGGGFWIASIITNYYTMKEWIISSVILAVSFICWHHSNELTFVMFAMALIAGKGVKIERTIKIMAILWWCIFGIGIILSCIGIIPLNIEWHTGKSLYYLTSFYFDNLNQFHLAFFICVLFYLLQRRKHNNGIIIMLILSNIVAYRFSRSETGLLTVFGTLLGFEIIWFTKGEKYQAFLAKILGFGCTIPILISVFIGIVVPESSWIYIWGNIFASRRFVVMRQFAKTYPITIWGQRFNKDMIVDGHVCTMYDNSFGHILYKHGLIIFAFLFILYALFIRKCVKTQQTRMLMCCLAFMVYGIAEQFFQNCFMNFSLLFLIDVFWEQIAGKINVLRKWNIYEKSNDSFWDETRSNKDVPSCE